MKADGSIGGSELQKSAARESLGSRNFAAIEKIFDQLPQRFKLLDAMKAAGIEHSINGRASAASVLRVDFKCIDLPVKRGERWWKKP